LTVESPVALPSNRFLTPQRDRRWPHVLSAVLLVSGIVLTVLILVGLPRLKSTSIYYETNRLRTEVEELQRRRHELAVEFERERNPIRLGERAQQLGLQAPPSDALGLTAPKKGSP
jgi:hypothetical protein